jgi:hypothetical protein
VVGELAASQAGRGEQQPAGAQVARTLITINFRSIGNRGKPFRAYCRPGRAAEVWVPALLSRMRS